jgi:phage I-like protein
MRLITALLASAFALTPTTGEAQLLPSGTFAARDGRPGPGKSWKVNDAQGQRLAADINAIAEKTPIVIDYEHQTLRAESNGQPAPAAGWITRVEWRAGQGLFASVNWTDAAKARIANGEYRYISPVITADEAGNVVGMHLAALVNHPALLGMEPVVAQLAARFNHEPSESSMTLLAALITALAINADAKDADVVAAVTALKTKADAKPSLPAPLVTALGLQAGADEAAALSAITTLKGSTSEAAGAMAALQTQLATLTTQVNTDKVNQAVDGAIAAHKLVPAQRAWAVKLGQQDMTQLQAFIASAPVLQGLQGQSNGSHDPGGEGSDQDGADIALRATTYQVEQQKAGITVTTLQAVEHVMAKAAK